MLKYIWYPIKGLLTIILSLLGFIYLFVSFPPFVIFIIIGDEISFWYFIPGILFWIIMSFNCLYEIGKEMS